MPHYEPHERAEPSPVAGLRAILFVLAVLVLLPTLRPEGPSSYHAAGFELERDEGTVVYDSLRWAQGEIPYRDFFTFQTPGFYGAYAVALGAIREPTIEIARLLNVLVVALGTVLLAMCIARLAGRTAALGAALVHVTLLVAIWPIPYPHWLAETFALGGLAAICEPRWRARRAMIVGACFAAAALTIQSLGIPLLAAGAIVSASLSWGTGRLRAIGSVGGYLAGAIAVAAACLAYFAAHGALAQLAYCTWTWPFENYAAGNSDAMFYAADLSIYLREHEVLPPVIREMASIGLHALWVLPLIGLFGGVAGGIAIVLQLVRQRPAARSAAAALISAAAVVPLFSEKTRADIVHLGFVGSFGLVAAAAASGALDPRRRGWRAHVVAAAFVALGATTATAFAWKTVQSLARAPAASIRAYVRRDAERHPTTAGLWDWVEAHGAPNDTIVVVSDPGFHYLYLRRAAIPFTLLPLGREDDYLTERQWAWIARSIASNRPVALGIGSYQWRRLSATRPELRARYRPEAGFFVRITASRAP